MKTQSKIAMMLLPIILLKLKWGAFITEGRGKAGGTVFSKGRYGAYARNKVTPVDRKTSFQQAVKVVLTLFSQGFRALSIDQINAWNAAASSGFTSTNIFGDTIKKTGLSLYVALNTNLRTIGVAAISNPPVQAAVGNMVDIAPVINVGATELFLFGTNAAGTNTVTAGNTLVVLASPPVSRGVSFVSSQMRIIGTIAAAANTDTTNMWADYVAKFGAPVAGQKIFVGCTAVNLTTGQAGIPLKEYAIAGA